MSPTPLKRPALARERVRLTAAFGALAAIAIITGALASLVVGSPLLSREASGSDSNTSGSMLDWIPNIQLSPRTQVEAELDDAQRALDRAREILDKTERDGSLLPEELDELEHRLEAFGPHDPQVGPASGGDEQPLRQYRSVPKLSRQL